MLIKPHAVPESNGEWPTLNSLTKLNVVGMVGGLACHASLPSPPASMRLVQWVSGGEEPGQSPRLWHFQGASGSGRHADQPSIAPEGGFCCVRSLVSVTCLTPSLPEGRARLDGHVWSHLPLRASIMSL